MRSEPKLHKSSQALHQEARASGESGQRQETWLANDGKPQAVDIVVEREVMSTSWQNA
jgi:hypothetical protein